MRDLSVGKESSIIFQFALPMLIGNVFQQLYTLINSIIVGNFVGKEALAAVGASFPLIFTLISLVIGISIGATIVIAQYFGAKDMKNVIRAIDTLMVFTFFASIFVTIVGILFSKPIFKLIELPDDIYHWLFPILIFICLACYSLLALTAFPLYYGGWATLKRHCISWSYPRY